MKKKQILISILLLCIIFIIIGYYIYQNFQLQSDVVDTKTTRDIDTNINTDDGEEEIDWSKYSEYQITPNDSTEIQKEGIYSISGNFTKPITVQTTGNVKLILDNANIKSSTGAAIIVEEAENVLIYLEDGTTNTLEDASSRDDEEIDGALYSKDDLIIDGTGTLKITANYQDGIVSKDDLKIKNGIIEIIAADDGIRGKDSLYIVDGTFKITSSGDGFKSTNDTDSQKGYIYIQNGIFDIQSELDAMQAETKLIIEDGDFQITTGGGSQNSSTTQNWGQWGREFAKTSTTTSSAKGLKAVSNLVISGGTFNLNTSDDAIHSNNELGISNGIFTINSGDDGIHADTQLILEGGTIDIKKSYEGMESSKITIHQGTIHITASDDGMNVAGGKDSSSLNRPGENNFDTNSNHTLTIHDGNITIDADGDGIDANGSVSIYGGNIKIEGPTDNGNGTIDYDKEFIVEGGTFFAIGSNGMLQKISTTSQYNVVISLENYYEANSTIKILDKNNNEILSGTSSKKFSAIILSNSQLKKGETYILQINGTNATTFTITSLSNQVGNLGGMIPEQRGREPQR